MTSTSFDTRMKLYEQPTRIYLPPRTYTIIRIDGKAFHTFTKKLERPVSQPLVNALNAAAIALCGEMMGARLAYLQSDEVSFLLTDFERETSEPWFSGNVQKMASVSASIFTAHFNAAFNDLNLPEDFRLGDYLPRSMAFFDSRVYTIPSLNEVINYFIWRQQDASRNSLNMLASCHYSHKELMGKGSSDKHEMLYVKGVNWNDQPIPFKRGRTIIKMERSRDITWTHKKTNEVKEETIQETYWGVDNEIPVFTQDRWYLGNMIPTETTI